MHNRYLVSMLVAGAFAFAFGPRPSTSEAAPAPVKAMEGETLASTLKVQVDGGVRLSFFVKNATEKRVELSFPSAHTHDFAILDSVGREVWRWSEGRMFTQALQTRTVGAGEVFSYEDSWDAGDLRGEFTAVATLNSRAHPVEQRVEFTLP
jgi:hypothetical protein